MNYQQKYYSKNRELILAKKHAYYLDNREAISEKRREWYEQNKERLRKARYINTKEAIYANKIINA